MHGKMHVHLYIADALKYGIIALYDIIQVEILENVKSLMLNNYSMLNNV